jgi:hypothetical protein
MTLLASTLVACGSETAEEAGLDDELVPQETAGQEVRACSVLDLPGATRVLGSGTEHPGGDTEQFTCLYSNAGVGMLTVQLNPAAAYDQVTILPPHTPVQVGDKARYNIQETGVIAVQFVAGAHSVTMSLQPIGTSETDFLPPLLSAAREVAAQLP